MSDKYKHYHYLEVLAFIFALSSPDITLAEEAAKPAEPPKPLKIEKECLSYEPGVVTLKGHLQRPGAFWVLELDHPTCIDQREKEEEFYPAVDEVQDILFWRRKHDSLDQYNEFRDKEVIVTGTLHHKNTDANTGDIMMMVAHIELVKEDLTNDRK